MSGISSSFNVSTRSKIGLYCLISAALRSDFQDCISCRAVSSPDSLVQRIMQLLLVSKQIHFFGGSHDNMNSELLFSPNTCKTKANLMVRLSLFPSEARQNLTNCATWSLKLIVNLRLDFPMKVWLIYRKIFPV